MKPPTPDSPTAKHDDAKAMLRSLVAFNAQVLGVTLGILCALGIFVTTNFLILKGGPNVGEHLQLLGQFFYGYHVTFLGSIIGSFYGFVVGWVAGALIGILYNWVAYLRAH